MRSSKTHLDFQYIFSFEDGDQLTFDLSVNLPSLTLNRELTTENLPEWTLLSYHQCPNCSLSRDDHQFCPIALNIQDLIYAFQDKLSFHQVTVTVITQDRTYSKSVALQRGVSSLMGIYMATSGCPVMEKIKPMVRYHLPFASLEETLYRIISMYLVSQYLLFKQGGEPDWNLDNLITIYEEIRIVNQYFCKRLNSLTIQDANINAVVILNNFADVLPFKINNELLSSIAEYFQPYLDQQIAAKL